MIRKKEIVEVEHEHYKPICTRIETELGEVYTRSEKNDWFALCQKGVSKTW